MHADGTVVKLVRWTNESNRWLELAGWWCECNDGIGPEVRKQEKMEMYVCACEVNDSGSSWNAQNEGCKMVPLQAIMIVRCLPIRVSMFHPFRHRPNVPYLYPFPSH